MLSYMMSRTQNHPAGFTCKAFSAEKQHEMSGYLKSFYKHARRSVYRVTYFFHHSVELLWLISVYVVRGVVYQLHGERDEGIKIRKQSAVIHNHVKLLY